MKNSDSPKKPKSYGSFSIAAIVYALGVLAFAIWSYMIQKDALLAHIDQSLLNATYAAEQIIGKDYITVLSGIKKKAAFLEDDLYAEQKAKLDRYAEACGFDALGAAIYSDGETRNLIAGIKTSGMVHEGDLQFRDQLPPELSGPVNTLASTQEEISTSTIYLEDHGKLRIAIRYKAISPASGYALVASRSIEFVNQAMRKAAVRTFAAGLFLLIMAFPLVALYNRAQQKAADELAGLNHRLRTDVENQKTHEIELKDAIRDLERFNSVTVGRENRIIELKAEVNMLLEEMHRQKRYNVDQAE